MINYKVCLLPSSVDDLNKIVDYITNQLHSPITAQQVKQRIINSLKKLSYTAESAPWLKNKISTIGGKYEILQYTFPYKGYIAFFYVDKNAGSIFIINILSTLQNYSTLFIEE